jgi:electron transfer flavoprotein beta subunit
MKARKKELLTIAAVDLHQAGALQETVKIEFPLKKIGGLFLEGEITDIADRLISILKEKKAVPA